ncbi:MAG: rRNA pseudouridine synthase [Dorea sp.]|nr:rRNA pseudouridine synthase [Dorea sp.]
MMIRLDKYLADMGEGTRQEVKKSIRQGRILVEGAPVKKPEYKIDETKQRVTIDGREICYRQFEYFMLNKPAGVVSATEDPREKTVISLIGEAKRKDLFPAGRLDKDTEGLLLITNDGALAHRLLSPRHHVDKCYYAKIQGIVTEEDVKRFAEGVNIGTKECEEWTAPGGLEILKKDEASGISEIRLTLQEGKYHQVKRMFEAAGKTVTYLRRESMGSLVLDQSLKPGQYRRLTDEELESL